MRCAGTRARSLRPTSSASTDTLNSARNAPSPTATGSAYRAATPIAVTCDASPHSARNSVPNEMTAARGNGVGGRGSGVAAASRSVVRLSRSSSTAPTPNSTAIAAATTRSGSSRIALPSVTAMTACAANATAAPAKTARPRNRPASTRVSAVVLSGSSSRNTAT
jgi:hypothetical protein